MIRTNSSIIAMVCCIAVLIVITDISSSFGQCNLKADYKVEQDNSGNTSILLKLEQGSGFLSLYLVDLNDPQNGPIQQIQKSAQELKGDFVSVFSNVPQSNYIIQIVDGNKCQISIGGLEGIAISTK